MGTTFERIELWNVVRVEMCNKPVNNVMKTYNISLSTIFSPLTLKITLFQK